VTCKVTSLGGVKPPGEIYACSARLDIIVDLPGERFELTSEA